MNCPGCGGALYLLGRLARLWWYRCRDCGWEFSTETAPPEEVDA